jgi:hypothetical protein
LQLVVRECRWPLQVISSFADHGLVTDRQQHSDLITAVHLPNSIVPYA